MTTLNDFWLELLEDGYATSIKGGQRALANLDIDAEYILIKAGHSVLSSNTRALVVAVYEKVNAGPIDNEDDIDTNHKGDNDETETSK